MTRSQVCIVTGCAGLIGSETVKKFHTEGYHIIGIDNNGRKKYYGESGDTSSTLDEFINLKHFEFVSADITNKSAMESIFKTYGSRIGVVVHAASIPGHNSCDDNPYLAYNVNVTGTVNILECIREHCPLAVFIFTSSSKVYGNRHSYLKGLVELETRYDFMPDHPLYNGIPESYNPDGDDRSMLGSTKLAADVIVQQYALTYGIRSLILRPGCLVGGSHAGVSGHGYLSYLSKCIVSGTEYTIFGHKGKQVRDNWHSKEVIEAFWQFVQSPKKLGIYNIGGNRSSTVSTLEAIQMLQEYSGKKAKTKYDPTPRKADHKWFLGDPTKFLQDYPNYTYKYSLEDILRELCESWALRLKK